MSTRIRDSETSKFRICSQCFTSPPASPPTYKEGEKFNTIDVNLATLIRHSDVGNR